MMSRIRRALGPGLFGPILPLLLVPMLAVSTVGFAGEEAPPADPATAQAGPDKPAVEEGTLQEAAADPSQPAQSAGDSTTAEGATASESTPRETDSAPAAGAKE